MAKLKGIFSGKNQKHFPKFVPTLLFSFVSIIIMCTFIMGILSYNIVQKFMTEKIISSNNKLLNQYGSSIDIALVETVESISLKMMHDVNSSYYLNRYFNDPLDNILADIPEVSSYLNDMSVLNPLVFSLGIYYSNNNLLICTDYIRHTLYRTLESQEDLSHYYNIVQTAARSNMISEENVALIFDYGKNLGFKVSEIQVNRHPETIIHAVRVTFGYNRSIKGAVVVTVSGDIFKNFLSKYAPEDLGSVFIFNEEGTIISHTDSTYIGGNISELNYYRDLSNQQNESGYFISKGERGPVVVSYQPSSYSSWTYVSVAPMEAISEASHYILRVTLLIASFSVLIGMVMSVAGTRKLAKPIKSIAAYCLNSPYRFGKQKESNEYSLISETLNNMESMMQKKEEELKKVFPMLKMNFLSSLFSDKPPELEEVRARMKVLNISFPYKYYCPAAIKLENLKNTKDVVLYEIEKLNICETLENIFSTENSRCLFYEKDNIIKILINFDFAENVLYQLGGKLLDETCSQASAEISIKKHIAFGKVDTKIEHMSSSFKIALSGLKYFYVFPEKYILTFRDIISLEEKSSFSSRLLLNNLANSLRSLNRQKSLNDIENLVKTLRNGSYSFNQIYGALSTCVSLIEEFVSTQVNKDISLDKGFSNTINIFGFEAWIKKVISQAFTGIEASKSDNSELIAKIQVFIEENIQNTQLSLEYVAEELGINYKYLSKIFKSETGIKFIDYLTNIKLNHCRNLLINTDLKVEEISEIVGYSTPQYFISRFKLMFGCTPKKYRGKYKENNGMDGKKEEDNIGLYR